MSKASGGQSAWLNWCALAERIVADTERHHGRRSVRSSNPNHDEKGRFGEGGGGGSGNKVPQSARERIKETAKWMRSTPVKDVIAAVVKSDTTKEAVTFAVGSLIAHGLGSAHTGGGFWFAEPTLEQDLHTAIHYMSDHLQVTLGQARETLKDVVGKLRDLRAKVKAENAGKIMGADKIADDQLPTAEELQQLLDAIERFDPEG